MTADPSTDSAADDFDDDAPADTPATGGQQQPDGDVPPGVARALRQANKEAEKLRLRLKEYEDRDKTEQQKLEERAALAEQLAGQREHELLRLRVAVAKQLPTELVERLRGSNEKELAADADQLLALMGGGPQVGVDQGVRGTAAPSGMNDLIRRAARR